MPFILYVYLLLFIKLSLSKINAINTAGNRHNRTVGSAKKFGRITSGFGGGEFTKTLRKVCTFQKF
jgi:hypothetical protein